MFYRIDQNTNKVVELFGILPVFHPDLMYTIIESEIIPTENDIWNGSTFIPEFSNLELVLFEKDRKYKEVDIYVQNLITNAYSNPVNGITTNPVFHKNIILVRRNNKSDKIAGDITLTQEEKDESKTDQKLSEYEQKVLADLEKVKENINKLNTIQEVIDFNISVETWNVWTPPI